MKKREGLNSEEMRLKGLLNVLRSEPDEDQCQDCLNRLDEYIASQLAGEDYLALLADVAIHLDACPDCTAAYAYLYELEVTEVAHELPWPQQLPEPDLKFLRQPPIDLAALLQEALRQTVEMVTFQLSAELLPLLRPLPTAIQTRAPSDSQRYDEMLLNLDPTVSPEVDLPINLTIYQDAQQTELCLVEVAIKFPDQSWPDLGGWPVILNVGDQQHERITDAWGIASFESVEIDKLPLTTVSVKLT